MKTGKFALEAGLLASILVTLHPFTAHATTYEELVAKEEGVDFGECQLTPKPNLAGEKVMLMVPARFEDPAVWVTRSLLLVGINSDNSVQGQLELKMKEPVPPREVISIECKGSLVTISVSGKASPKVISYQWTGAQLEASKPKPSQKAKKR
jgi:hypothetical protein